MHNICCAFIGLDNKLYKMHGTYMKIHIFIVKFFNLIIHLSTIAISIWQTYSFKVTTILYKRKYALTPMRLIARKWTRKHVPDTFQHLKIIQGIHKRMVRFQKLTRNLFLTLHGHNLHCQQQQLSKFLMR